MARKAGSKNRKKRGWQSKKHGVYSLIRRIDMAGLNGWEVRLCKEFLALPWIRPEQRHLVKSYVGVLTVLRNIEEALRREDLKILWVEHGELKFQPILNSLYSKYLRLACDLADRLKLTPSSKTYQANEAKSLADLLQGIEEANVWSVRKEVKRKSATDKKKAD